MGKMNRARECFNEASKNDPSWPLPLEHLGLLEYSQEDFEASVTALKRYLEIGGKDLDVLLALMRAAYQGNDCSTVLSVTSAILENKEDLYEVWETRGLCQAKAEKFKAASVSLNMALDINPRSIEALNRVGDLCYEAANYVRALEFYGPSLAKDPEQPAILFRHATSLWFTGKWPQAIPLLEKYTERMPDDPKGWNNLGIALREKGLVARALECFSTALELDPGLEAPRKNMERAADKEAMP
jgi:tetratricopeptide (TPR) repeat protein